jgi:Kef-type K+ transport system membrane component KefB
VRVLAGGGVSFELPLVNPIHIMVTAVLAFLVTPFLARRLGLPPLVALIALGAVVGPHGLGVLARDTTIVLLGTVGLLYLLFVAGLELDLQGFARHRRRALVFGLLSFALPALGALALAPLFGFGFTATVMVAAIVASHTLLAYPVAARLGLARDPATTTVVGGTLLTDTLSLALLAVVGALAGGGADGWFWVRLVAALALYVTLVVVALPRVARWFFRLTDAEATVRYVFLLAALFFSAGAAQAAGAQPIIGAFLAGLAINRLVPQQSTMMARVRFVGDAFFIPFFMLSVGMLVDVRVMASVDVLVLAAMFLVLVLAGKGGSALIAARVLGFDRARAVLMAGLSVPQAAATLAVTFVGLEIGLFDAVVVNAVIVLIVASVVVGAVTVQRAGRVVALRQQSAPGEGAAPHRVLVPLANPQTAELLLDVAFLLRPAASPEAVYPVTVVLDTGAIDAKVAAAERVLAHAVVYAAEAEVPVIPLTRVAVNPASGITAAARERRITDIVIGWQGGAPGQRAMFGRVIDQVIEGSTAQVLVCRLRRPIALTGALYVVLPAAIDFSPGFHEAVRSVDRLAAHLGLPMTLVAVRADAARLARRFQEVRQAPGREAAPVTESLGAWSELPAWLAQRVAPEDLVVVVAARGGTVAWSPALERLPGQLDALPSSFVALFPSERSPEDAAAAAAGSPLPLTPARVLLHLPSPALREVLDALLRTVASPDDRHYVEALDALAGDDVGYASEVLPDTVVAHARSDLVTTAAVAVGFRRAGLAHPRAGGPVVRVAILVSPAHEEAAVHLARLALLVQRLHDAPAAAMAALERPEDVVAALRPAPAVG